MLQTDRLRNLRLKMNLDQDELAAALGKGYRQVHRYENGQSEPPASVLAHLAKIFGVSADYLLGLTDQPRGTYEEPDLNSSERLLILAFRSWDLESIIQILATQSQNKSSTVTVENLDE
jgi:transcriptional regulator with XRE-family HTH domain